jgi:hypothetical protein
MMRVIERYLCAALTTCLLSAGCADNPAEPTSGLDGTWRGEMTRGAVTGTTTLQLVQSGAGVTGTWSADLEGTTFDQSGTVSGTVTASTVALFLQPGSPLVCGSAATLSGTLTVNGSLSGDRLSGDYVVFGCDAASTGRIDVQRQ